MDRQRQRLETAPERQAESKDSGSADTAKIQTQVISSVASTLAAGRSSKLTSSAGRPAAPPTPIGVSAKQLAYFGHSLTAGQQRYGGDHPAHIPVPVLASATPLPFDGTRALLSLDPRCAASVCSLGQYRSVVLATSSEQPMPQSPGESCGRTAVKRS